VEIKKFTEDFSVCKVRDITQIDFNDKFCFLGKTDEELSLVCLTNKVPENTTDRDDGWTAFRIQRELDFSLNGILTRISGILADHEIGIFAISTYNTDYILTKAANYEKALAALKAEGYEIV
jgi:hypothetical protein